MLLVCILSQVVNTSHFFLHPFFQGTVTRVFSEYRRVDVVLYFRFTSRICTDASPTCRFVFVRCTLCTTNTVPKSTINDISEWMMLVIRNSSILPIMVTVFSALFTVFFVKSQNILAAAWWQICFAFRMRQTMMRVTVQQMSFLRNRVHISFMLLFFTRKLVITWQRRVLMFPSIWQNSTSIKLKDTIISDNNCDWLVELSFLNPTWCKIRQLGDIPSQSLGLVPKNYTQHK